MIKFSKTVPELKTKTQRQKTYEGIAAAAYEHPQTEKQVLSNHRQDSVEINIGFHSSIFCMFDTLKTKG